MKKNYSELLKDPRWQKKRLQIMERDGFVCTMCGDDKSQLHIHHKKYINGNDPWNYEDEWLATLCEDCHEVIGNTIKDFKERDSIFEYDKVRIFGYYYDNYKVTYYRYENGSVLVIIKKEDQKFSYIIPSAIKVSGVVKLLKTKKWR